LVWQPLGSRPQAATKGSEYGPVHHCGRAPCHPGPLYQAVSEEGPKYCQRLRPPKPQTVLSVTARHAVPGLPASALFCTTSLALTMHTH
jgi:hypothetical protein